MYTAHKQAWENAHILHRDVSMSNILIDVKTGSGFLNDWDLCKYGEELGGPPSQENRSVSVFPGIDPPDYDGGIGNLAIHVGGAPQPPAQTERAGRRPGVVRLCYLARNSPFPRAHDDGAWELGPWSPHFFGLRCR